MAFDGVAKTLHWLMALLLVVMFWFGLGLEDLSLAERREALPQHASLGLVLFVLAIVRLAWRRRHPAPPYPDSMTAGQKKWAKGVVHAFYALMIAQPLLGFMQAATYVDFEGVTQPAPAPRFSRTQGEIKSPAALAGEHSEQVLRDWGFDETQIDNLKTAAAI